MQRTLVFALLIGALATAQDKAPQEKSAIQFHLKKDPHARMKGWCLEYNDAGFKFEKFGIGTAYLIRWEELVDEDASKLRQRFKLELTHDERLGLIPGQEMHFKGGGSRRGLLVRHESQKKRYWFRHDGLILPYPEDRVDRFEDIKIKESEVYSEEDVYIRRLQRTLPKTAVEHRLLADYMFDIGNWNKAGAHYRTSIEMEPGGRKDLENRLAEIKDYLEDTAAAGFFRKAKSLANLHGDYDGAIEMIEDYIKHYSGSKRRGFRVIDEIRTRRHQKYVVQFHRLKNKAMDRVIKRYLSSKRPNIQAAMSWATTQMKDDIEARVRGKMNISKDEFVEFSKAKVKYSPHYATYWSGTFVVSKRAKKGTGSAKTIRGDPDKWWFQYADTKTRSTFIKAYAAEHLPDLFEVIQIRTTPCEKCGGKGRVKHMSLRGLKALNGGHEWWETCPRCFGAREDRSVVYR